MRRFVEFVSWVHEDPDRQVAVFLCLIGLLLVFGL